MVREKSGTLDSLRVSGSSYGRYQLIKKLAAGGMAEVFLARQQGLEGFEKLLVVKRILPHLANDEEFVQMFLNEARIAARFNHANIVQIYDLGKAEETYFIGMEYVHGEDLGRIMRKAWNAGRWIPMPLAVRVVAQACEGLHYAHTKLDEDGRPLNVVHRDISPQNILVSFDGGVKVVDFGIAKAADNTNGTRTGTIKGKYAYMSPEQAQGKAVDARTDIFALGLVLYELLTGVRPLKRETDIQTLQAALSCEIEPPSKVASVSATLDPVVMKALNKDVAGRYQTAREFQLALEEYLVEQRLSASSVHLSEFMRELFADRLEEERKSGRPQPATESQTSMPAVSDPEPSAPAPETGPRLPDVPEWDAPPGSEVAPRPAERPKRATLAPANPSPPRRTRSAVANLGPPEPAPEPLEELDPDDAPTSLEANQTRARRTTGAVKRVSGEVRRPSGQSSPAAARPASRSRATSTSSGGGMPEAPPRQTTGSPQRDGSWKESGRKPSIVVERPRRSPVPMVAVFCVLVLGGGVIFHKDISDFLGQQPAPTKATAGHAPAAGSRTLLHLTSGKTQTFVEVNGETVGLTPVDYEVPAGEVKVRFYKNDVCIDKTRLVTVREGETLEVAESFTTAKVIFKTDSGRQADITCDGKRLGQTGAPIAVAEGTHTFVARASNNTLEATRQEKIPNGSGALTFVDFTLKPVGGR